MSKKKPEQPSRRAFLKTAAIIGAGSTLGGAAGAQSGKGRAMTNAGDHRKVLSVKKPPARHWVGDGFPVRTMISYSDDAAAISPFLLLDYAPPADFPPASERRGVGEHPHRGFETVTVAYQGEVEHRDSAGNAGRIGPGDVQWMTAASGIVHEEMHGRELTRKGGVMEMAQIWVNLPAKSKMSPPGYQDISGTKIPTVALPGDVGTVRVIAGECNGVRGAARTFTPVHIWDVKLARGSAELAIPAGQTAMVLVRRGSVYVNGDTPLPEGHLAILDRKGRTFQVGSSGEAEVLVLGGEPIAEPVFGQGPFVMNTREEIDRAIMDYRSGRMGHLK